MSKVSAALDAAAALLAAATGVPVAVDPTSTSEPEANGDDVKLAAALSTGATTVLGEALGNGADRFELQHDARFSLVAAGGPEDKRRAAVVAAWTAAGAAIAGDPTLGGRVDYAVLEAADDEGVAEAALRGLAGGAATLSLTFTAAHPNA